MAQQTKRFSQQLLAGSQKGAWRGHETNPKSKSYSCCCCCCCCCGAVWLCVPCPVSLSFHCCWSWVIVSFPLFVPALTFMLPSSDSSPLPNLSPSLYHGFALVGFSTHTIENSIDLQNEVAFGLVRSLPPFHTFAIHIPFSLFLGFLSIFILVFTSGTTIFELFSGFA